MAGYGELCSTRPHELQFSAGHCLAPCQRTKQLIEIQPKPLEFDRSNPRGWRLP